VNFVHEVLEHLFRIRKISDDAILHGPHGCNMPGRSPDHLLCLCAHGDHDLAAARGFILHGND
jgi:hypothetical protein